MKKISLSAVAGALIAVGMVVQVSASASYTSAGSKIEFKNMYLFSTFCHNQPHQASSFFMKLGFLP